MAAVLTRTLAGLVILGATAWLLNALSLRQATAWLRDSAAHGLVLAARGESPYRWRFADRSDLVAGRVFGATRIAFDTRGLDVRSDGSAFEIGLPLTRPADLRRFPVLQVAVDVEAPASLTVVARTRLDAPQQITAAKALPAGRQTIDVDLSNATWRQPDRTADAPSRAAMLRLRFSLPRDAQLHLSEAGLRRLSGAPRIDLQRAPRVVDAPAQVDSAAPALVRLHANAVDADFQPLDRDFGAARTPLVLLPARTRVEPRLLLYRSLVAAIPSVVAVPEDAATATFAQARAELAAAAHPAGSGAPWQWIALGSYLLVLIAARVRPPAGARVRAALELTLVLAGPLWLVVGGHFDGSAEPLPIVLIAGVLAYAVSLRPLHPWQWIGTKRAWWPAGAVVAAAAALGLVLHAWPAPLRPLDAGHVARYLLWALLQQYLICVVCTERWRRVTGGAVAAVYLGALGFALLHTPNATLMLATFAGGLCWCALYLCERALLPLAVSHAVSALLLMSLLPPQILLSAEVGARYFY